MSSSRSISRSAACRWVLCAAVVCLHASRVHADDRYWVGGPVGDWSNTAFWSLAPSPFGAGGASLPDDRAILSHVDSLDRRIIFDVPTPTVINFLAVTSRGSGTTTLEISQGDLESGDTIIAGLTSSTGLIEQSGMSVASLGQMILGYEENSVGRYEMNGGTLNLITGTLGRIGEGQVEQFDGDLNVGTYRIGDGVGSKGTHTIHAGTMSTGSMHVGFGGQGAMNQYGGDLDVHRLWIGSDLRVGSSGVYTMTDGTLDVTRQVYVGSATDGTFQQQAGSVSAGEGLFIGLVPSEDGLEGIYQLDSGHLNTPTTVVGLRGDATFTQNGGNHTIAGQLLIGEASDLSNNVFADYFMADGVLEADTVLLGKGNAGRISRTRFVQSGGEARFANGITLADDDSPGQVTGRLTLSGGELHTPSITDGGAEAILDLLGGELYVDQIGMDVANAGATISPIDLMNILTVGGTFQQDSGVLRLGLGGTTPGVDQGRLQASGEIVLGGDVFIELLPGFMPDVGDTFDIGLSLSFAALDDPSVVFAQPGYAGELSVASGNTVRLTITQVPEPVSLWMLGAGAAFVLSRRCSVGSLRTTVAGVDRQPGDRSAFG